MSAALDVNTADQAALDAYPPLAGHGYEIVRYREERGRFTALRQLDEVPGLAGKLDADALAGLSVWKTALITGATAGIGLAAARRFVRGGWRVIATGRRQERLDALAQELGDTLHPLAFDMRDEVAREAAIAGLADEFAGVDLLVNNAGLALGTAPAQAAKLSDWATMIDTNIAAVIALTHRLLPTLIERRGGIVNLSSVAATYPYAGGNVYGATKAFIRQWSLGLRSDLHGTGVRVTSIEPGMVETEFTAVRTGSQAASDQLYAGAQPMTGEDIAETIWWIATLPPHLNINALELMPVSQSFAGFQVART